MGIANQEKRDHMNISTTTHERHQKFSIMSTISWLIILTVGVQLCVGIIILSMFKVTRVEFNDLESLLLRPEIMLLGMIITVIISIPLIRKATRVSEDTFPFHFLAIKPIEQATLKKTLVLGVLYYCLMSTFMHLVNIDTPQYMLDAKFQVNSSLDLAIHIISICIMAPIFEELIFRGLAFSRLQYSKAGPIGAIIVTSIFFTIIHIQYELMILVFLFPTALLYGFIRYKTDNVTYCIALHILCNSLSTFELFVLLQP